MINLIQELYETKIIQQEIAIYIIQDQYCNLLNEDSKLQSFKDFAQKKLERLRELVSSAWDKIIHFFTDIIAPKIHKLKNKEKKDVKNDNKTLKTEDIILMINDFNEVINLKKSTESAYPGNNPIDNFTYDIKHTRSAIDDYNEKVEKYAYTCDKVKEKMADIQNKKYSEIKIGYKKIFDLYNENINKLDKEFKYDINKAQQSKKNITGWIAQTGRDCYDEEFQPFFKEAIKAVSKVYDTEISLYSSYTKIYNKLFFAITGYFDKYLSKENKEDVNSKNEDKKKDEEEEKNLFNEYVAFCKAKKKIRVAIILKDRVLLYHGTNDNYLKKMFEIAKKYGCVDTNYNSNLDPIRKNETYDEDYLNQQMVAYVNNPCEKRFLHLLEVCRKLYSK